MCLPRVCSGALASTFFRCHTEKKVAAFFPKMTFKDHIFIGEKPFLLPPLGSSVLLTHALSLTSWGPNILQGLDWKKAQRLPGVLSESVKGFSLALQECHLCQGCSLISG